MAKKEQSPHPNHIAHVKNLNRVIGQLEGVKRMIEDRRYCADILTQTRAAASALKKIEISILETHLIHCVTDALNSKSRAKGEEKIKEFTNVVRQF